MGGGIFKSKPTPAISDTEFGSGSADAKRILAEMKVLEKNIETWSKKIYEVQDDKLEDKFRAERAEFVRRLGVLRHRPRPWSIRHAQQFVRLQVELRVALSRA